MTHGAFHVNANNLNYAHISLGHIFHLFLFHSDAHSISFSVCFNSSASPKESHREKKIDFTPLHKKKVQIEYKTMMAKRRRRRRRKVFAFGPGCQLSKINRSLLLVISPDDLTIKCYSTNFTLFNSGIKVKNKTTATTHSHIILCYSCERARSHIKQLKIINCVCGAYLWYI